MHCSTCWSHLKQRAQTQSNSNTLGARGLTAINDEYHYYVLQSFMCRLTIMKTTHFCAHSRPTQPTHTFFELCAGAASSEQDGATQTQVPPHRRSPSQIRVDEVVKGIPRMPGICNCRTGAGRWCGCKWGEQGASREAGLCHAGGSCKWGGSRN